MSQRVSRRGALAAFGGIGLGTLLASCAGGASSTVNTGGGSQATVSPQTPPTGNLTELFGNAGSCSLTMGETEGPYYFDVDAIRSDIREDRTGVPLLLAIQVRDAGSCAPLPNAVVEIWHCDAVGSYSGFEAASGGGGGGPGGGGRTDDETYLRGAQVTNSDGIVQFQTIYPGWYAGRTVHIHSKVHVNNKESLTTQLYFDDSLSDRVYAANAPYSSHANRSNRNDNDNIFDDSLMLTVSERSGGYLGVITYSVKPA